MPLVDQRRVVHAVNRSIATVLAERPPLDFARVHERTVAHRLALALELHFRTWNIDCEYNRDQGLYKMLEGIAACDPQRRTDRIFPDIIVHHRGAGGTEHNLLVIELKRSAHFDNCDFEKLSLLTRQDGHYRYQYSVYLNISDGRFLQTWFVDGTQIEIVQETPVQVI